MHPLSPLALSLASLLAGGLAAQLCPPPQSVVPPFTIPVAAGGWSIQHFGQPLVAGQIDYILISLPTAAPLPFAALPAGIFCNVVGNTPCIYADQAAAVTWLAFGPSTGNNVTVGITWPVNPAFSGILFVAQTGTAGCAGPAPDLSVLITGQIL